MLLKNEWVNNEIKEEIKTFWKQMKMNSQQSKTYETQWRQSWEKIHSDTGLPKKDRDISNKPNPKSIRTRGKTTNKAQNE